jgi:hypothetical protein
VLTTERFLRRMRILEVAHDRRRALEDGSAHTTCVHGARRPRCTASACAHVSSALRVVGKLMRTVVARERPLAAVPYTKVFEQ